MYALYEEFEDTKGVIRIRILKKNRQHNGQKKRYKSTNNLVHVPKMPYGSYANEKNNCSLLALVKQGIETTNQ